MGSRQQIYQFDYQSERHCSKTGKGHSRECASLITSQNVTAPKHVLLRAAVGAGLITSQNVTAPKHMSRVLFGV